MANLQQPLSLGCAEPAPLEGEPFPLRRGINLSGASRQLPWEGSLFLQLFPLLPAENRPGGQRGGKTGRPVRTSARSTRTFCTPQNKKRETVHIAAGSALVGGYFV